MGEKDTGGIPRRRFLQGAGAGLALGAIGGFAGSAAVARRSSHADLVLYNGAVLTLSGEFRPYQAIAVKDGVVRTVGESSDVRRLIGTHTDVVNLRGRTVIPGINDSHFHPMSYGTSQPPLTLAVGRDDVESIADIREVIAQAVKDKEPGEWIRGFGWDQGYLAEGRYPTKEDLDDIAPENPVLLQEWSAHAVWVNSKALEIAGIDGDTEPPPGGEIVKDGAGEPTGILLEGAAYLINEHVPPFTDAERRQGMILAADAMHAHGITSVTDASGSPESVKLYQELLASGDMRQRMTVMMGSSTADPLREALEAVRAIETDRQWLNPSQVKIFADGVPTQAKTAWVSEEYEGGGHGGLTLAGDTEEEQLQLLHELVMISHENGFQIGTHACGDRTIDAAVEAYAQAVSQHGAKDLRHYIIHADLASRQALAELGRLGMGVNFNPGIKRSLSHQLLEVLGRDRTDHQFPYRSALENGVTAASSSDAPITPPDFLEGITAMMTRRSLATGEVFGEDQIIDFEEALRSYTVAGAWQDAAEDFKGDLGEGKAADLVVLDGDLVNTPAEEIVDMKVGMTVVGGEVVFDASSASIPQAFASAASLRAAGHSKYMTHGCCDHSTAQGHGAHS
ncbi:amidohydrolase [Nesterenkonia rhizosphaerae]|uniref:Amidohydrolase n=1 Tax=Nesterenkonia rhizosphaerae TaxID=1348272 RepID=A0ABP9FQH7_9MICC